MASVIEYDSSYVNTTPGKYKITCLVSFFYPLSLSLCLSFYVFAFVELQKESFYPVNVILRWLKSFQVHITIIGFVLMCMRACVIDIFFVVVL